LSKGAVEFIPQLGKLRVSDHNYQVDHPTN